MASPDEPAHAAKAAATVRGQFVADESEFNAGRGNFQLPALFDQAWNQTCFAFQPDTPASCSPEIGGDLERITDVTSHVARYNPVYYALIGTPTLAPLSEWTFASMRLVSALINAFLIALTITVVVGLRRPFLPLFGVLAAMTPMTFFIGGSMTPQGPEVFGSLLVAVSLLALVFDPDPDRIRHRGWVLVIGTAFFVLARGLSPAYLLMIIVFVVLAAPRFVTVWDTIKDRRFWGPLAACVGLSLVGVVYTLASGSLALGVVYPDPTLTARDVVTTMLRGTDYYLEQILGTFGWGDTHLPMLLLIGIGGVALALGILAMAFGSWRERSVLTLVVLASIVTPIALQVASFRESGIVWQGKYILPIAMLAPVLAGFIAARADALTRASAGLVRTVAALVAILQVWAVVVNIHRYVNGANGPWTELIPNPWAPLIPVVLIVGVQVACWASVIWVVRRWSRSLDAVQPISESPARAATGSEAD
ncbi:putative membrane protein DUF2142 [Microbacterium sp. SLBN-146]|nr:putative membrane protein DUF2142 [Microbacterium sp. SLBN-146]